MRLSADFGLSATALAALGPYRGSIVLVDLATGAVLAAVTDARTRAAEGGTPAFEQRREPASIAKIVTTAAAWRAGHDAEAEVSRMVCNGSHRYKGGILWCSYPAGPLTGGLKQAFAVSCNIAFANLAIEIGWRAMVDELRLWGFDRTRDEVPGAGRVLETQGTERDLACSRRRPRRHRDHAPPRRAAGLGARHRRDAGARAARRPKTARSASRLAHWRGARRDRSSSRPGSRGCSRR